MSDNWETSPQNSAAAVPSPPDVLEPTICPLGSTMTTRTLRKLLLLCLAAGSVPGCERVDWNWDASWWRTPRPHAVVKPAPSQEGGQRSREEDSTARTNEPRRADNGNRAANAEGSPAAAKNRPYYQLYLLSNDPPSEVPRGAGRLRLRHVAARHCAAVLEMLYVPLGRSGSREECYLIYEQREEFDAARALGPLLDVRPSKEPPITSGVEAALSNGIALMLWIIREDTNAGRTATNHADVDRCVRFLAEAAQSGELPPRKRWAAAVLAGRLLSTYRHDHVGARSHFNQAKRQTDEGSIEEMTAEWWRADTFVQEGSQDRANAIYGRILSDFRGMWPDASIIARSKAIRKKHRKR